MIPIQKIIGKKSDELRSGGFAGPGALNNGADITFCTVQSGIVVSGDFRIKPFCEMCIRDRVIPMQNRTVSAITSAFKLVVIEPSGFEECPKLVDSLKSKKPIIINLERIESDTARKIFDFLSGATYALNGNVQKVANNIFVFAPENVDIAAGVNHKGFSFENEKKNGNPWK